MSGGRLVTEGDVRRAAHASRTLALPPGAVVTPAARDLATQLGVVLTPTGEPVRPKPTVALGCDHAGFALKEQLKPLLAELGFDALDVGSFDTEAVDYPDYAVAVARAVADGRAWRGIMIDGAGIGSSMAANKVRGVRASLCYDLTTAQNARAHNDANLLTLGGALIGPRLAAEIVRAFLITEFAGGRHARRVEKINQLDRNRQA